MGQLIVPLCGVVLVALTTLIHYEMLRLYDQGIDRFHVHHRMRVVLVIFGAFTAHETEIGLYGLVWYLLAHYGNVGTLVSPDGASLTDCLYFSAEMYTSLGATNIQAVGPIRYLSGIEALNGLLLITWTATFTYITIQRYWNDADEPRGQQAG